MSGGTDGPQEGSPPSTSRVLVLLALVTALSILGFVAVAEVYPCLTVSYSGEGTADNPYEVSNLNQLQCVNQDLDAHYEQVSDIDASETEGWNDGRGFLPIGSGTLDDVFNGTYDGAGYTITNLTIDRRVSAMERSEHILVGQDEDGRIVGLFGTIGPHAEVTNVSTVNADVVGVTFVGTLAGRNRGTVSRSHATGDVEGADFVGGLVGLSIGKSPASVPVIERSYSLVNVSGSVAVGGLSSENAASEGSNAIIRESYAAGEVNGEDVGGLAAAGGGSTVNSYWDVNATGQNSSVGGTGLTTEQMTGETARGNMTGFDFESTWETVPEGYPRLSDALAPDAP